MELIFYGEAADMLGVKVDTINQAIGRGVLTQAGRKGRNMLLIREQVQLFTGVNPRTGNKKRLSFEVLSPSERAAWDTFALQAGTETPAAAPRRDEIRAIVQAEVDEREGQLEEAFAAFLMQMGMQFKELRHGLKQNREVPQGGPFPMKSLEKTSRAS